MLVIVETTSATPISVLPSIVGMTIFEVAIRTHADGAARWCRRNDGLLLPELLPIQFVGLLEVRNVTGFGREWRTLEVGVFERVCRIDTLAPIKLQQVTKQRNE